MNNLQWSLRNTRATLRCGVALHMWWRQLHRIGQSFWEQKTFRPFQFIMFTYSRHVSPLPLFVSRNSIIIHQRVSKWEFNNIYLLYLIWRLNMECAVGQRGEWCVGEICVLLSSTRTEILNVFIISESRCWDSNHLHIIVKVKQSRYRPGQAQRVLRKLRFPDFVTTAQDGGKVVSLTHRPPLPSGNTPGTHFC